MEQQWKVLLKRIQQPKIILAVVFVLGILVNVSLYLNGTMPQLLLKQTTVDQYRELDQERIQLEAVKTPEQISTEAMEQLVHQVPLSPHSARFLLHLKEIEKDSGVEIQSIIEGSDEQKEEATELINAQGKANIPAAGYTNKPVDPSEGADPNAAPNDAEPAVPFVKGNLTVVIKGTYGQLIDYVNQLGDLERVVYVKEWDLEPLPTLPIIGDNKEAEMRQMTIKISLYSANQYAGKFPDLPPVPVFEEPEHRKDPTISDDHYYEILDSFPPNERNSIVEEGGEQ